MYMAGTATLEELDPLAAAPHGEHVKKAKDGTILVPQPSDDPRDPLVSIDIEILEEKSTDRV